MATNATMQLADGEGLMSVVIFSGLSHSMIMHPAIHGEPALTAQAFYYLEELDAVAQLRFEAEEEHLSDEAIEYLVDNYLFEYSKRHPNAKISFKVTRGKFVEDDASEHYIGVDLGHTLALAIDSQNDQYVGYVKAVDASDRIDLTDWNIGMNYVMDRVAPYVHDMGAVLGKRIQTLIAPGPDRDGYVGKMRVLKTDHGLIDYWQAVGLSNIRLHSISTTATTVPLAHSACAETLDALPIERIDAHHQYTPVLLSHYFSGLKEFHPLKAFVGFYNVLEYYFEEAPLLLGRVATSELNQLHCIIELLVSDADVTTYFATLRPNARLIVTADLPTAFGVRIRAFDPTASSPRTELARWLYEIRCAVVHSKKTRRGHPSATFEPYSAPSDRLQHVVPLLRWLAIACIEKDAALRAAHP
ncbi:hypothetical protein [Variovorax sp. J31P207]|uniref:hypothetical protein n=1 Tax=Variovorax sp. J31P207 TaxID=3053510 RepID=UPI00257748E4|nr:hypothetical protein [Variovorax sp. J31P207]MDM0071634.1 hypothetical protein [Variovorax sp. J31P207]